MGCRSYGIIQMEEIEAIVKCVMAAFILHNLCIVNDDDMEILLRDDQIENDHTPEQGDIPNNAEGILKRNMLTRQLYGN